eukprot:gene2906-3340_t
MPQIEIDSINWIATQYKFPPLPSGITDGTCTGNSQAGFKLECMTDGDQLHLTLLKLDSNTVIANSPPPNPNLTGFSFPKLRELYIRSRDTNGSKINTMSLMKNLPELTKLTCCHTSDSTSHGTSSLTSTTTSVSSSPPTNEELPAAFDLPLSGSGLVEGVIVGAENVAYREDLVEWLFNESMSSMIVLMRATKGSGKTATCQLMEAYMRAIHPSFLVRRLSCAWPSTSFTNLWTFYAGSPLASIIQYSFDRPVFLIIEDIQILYNQDHRDYAEMWTAIKSLGTVAPAYLHLLLIESIDTASVRLGHRMPILRLNIHRISGSKLLLSQVEAYDVIDLADPIRPMPQILMEAIWEYTAGHVGLVLLCATSLRALFGDRLRDPKLLEQFIKHITSYTFVTQDIDKSGAFVPPSMLPIDELSSLVNYVSWASNQLIPPTRQRPLVSHTTEAPESLVRMGIVTVDKVHSFISPSCYRYYTLKLFKRDTPFNWRPTSMSHPASMAQPPLPAIAAHQANGISTGGPVTMAPVSKQPTLSTKCDIRIVLLTRDQCIHFMASNKYGTVTRTCELSIYVTLDSRDLGSLIEWQTQEFGGRVLLEHHASLVAQWKEGMRPAHIFRFMEVQPPIFRTEFTFDGQHYLSAFYRPTPSNPMLHMHSVVRDRTTNYKFGFFSKPDPSDKTVPCLTDWIKLVCRELPVPDNSQTNKLRSVVKVIIAFDQSIIADMEVVYRTMLRERKWATKEIAMQSGICIIVEWGNLAEFLNWHETTYTFHKGSLYFPEFNVLTVWWRDESIAEDYRTLLIPGIAPAFAHKYTINRCTHVLVLYNGLIAPDEIKITQQIGKDPHVRLVKLSSSKSQVYKIKVMEVGQGQSSPDILGVSDGRLIIPKLSIDGRGDDGYGVDGDEWLSDMNGYQVDDYVEPALGPPLSMISGFAAAQTRENQRKAYLLTSKEKAARKKRKQKKKNDAARKLAEQGENVEYVDEAERSRPHPEETTTKDTFSLDTKDSDDSKDTEVATVTEAINNLSPVMEEKVLVTDPVKEPENVVEQQDKVVATEPVKENVVEATESVVEQKDVVQQIAEDNKTIETTQSLVEKEPNVATSDSIPEVVVVEVNADEQTSPEKKTWWYEDEDVDSDDNSSQNGWLYTPPMKSSASSPAESNLSPQKFTHPVTPPCPKLNLHNSGNAINSTTDSQHERGNLSDCTSINNNDINITNKFKDEFPSLFVTKPEDPNSKGKPSIDLGPGDKTYVKTKPTEITTIPMPISPTESRLLVTIEFEESSKDINSIMEEIEKTSWMKLYIRKDYASKKDDVVRVFVDTNKMTDFFPWIHSRPFTRKSPSLVFKSHSVLIVNWSISAGRSLPPYTPNFLGPAASLTPSYLSTFTTNGHHWIYALYPTSSSSFIINYKDDLRLIRYTPFCDINWIQDNFDKAKWFDLHLKQLTMTKVTSSTPYALKIDQTKYNVDLESHNLDQFKLEVVRRGCTSKLGTFTFPDYNTLRCKWKTEDAKETLPTNLQDFILKPFTPIIIIPLTLGQNIVINSLYDRSYPAWCPKITIRKATDTSRLICMYPATTVDFNKSFHYHQILNPKT